MYDFRRSNRYDTRYKYFAKRHPDELQAVINNLDKLKAILNSGERLNPPPYGFLKSEGGGVYRISESGGGGSLMATRLYIYVDQGSEMIYLLTLGDKNTQQDDIQDSKTIVRGLRSGP